MNISRFFIDRPVFAGVLSILIFIVGLISLPSLPVSQYPEIVPPTVVVRAHLSGRQCAGGRRDRRHADRAADQRRGEHAVHVAASATNNGNMTLTVTFKLGTDLDNAQVQVQNRVALARAADCRRTCAGWA